MKCRNGNRVRQLLHGNVLQVETGSQLAKLQRQIYTKCASFKSGKAASKAAVLKQCSNMTHGWNDRQCEAMENRSVADMGNKFALELEWQAARRAEVVSDNGNQRFLFHCYCYVCFERTRTTMKCFNTSLQNAEKWRHWLLKPKRLKSRNTSPDTQVCCKWISHVCGGFPSSPVSLFEVQQYVRKV